MDLLKGILKNTLSLTFGKIGANILGVFFVALLAREVGSVGLGVYSFAGSLIAMFMILPHFGFDLLLIRETAKSKAGGEEIIGNILTIKLVLAIFASLFLIAFILLRRYDRETVQIIMIMLVSGVLTSTVLTFYSIFRAYERMQAEAILVLLNNVVRLLIGITCIKFGLSLKGIISGLVIADGFTLLCGVYVTRRRFVKVRLRMAPEVIKKIFRVVIPFGVLSLINIVFFNTDILMIARLQGESAVGWYSAALRILMLLFLILSMFMHAIYPVLSRLSVSGFDSLRQTYSKSFSYMMMLALPIAVGGFLISDQVILTIYGAQFHNSVVIFRVMVWVTVFSFVGFVNGACLNAIGKERLFAWLQSCVTVGNVILDYFFIKKFGYIGACYVTLILTGFGFVVYSSICHRHLGIKPELGIVGKSLIASIVMGAGILFLREISLNLLLVIPTGIVIYLGMILLFGAVPKKDSLALRRAVYKSPV